MVTTISIDKVVDPGVKKHWMEAFTALKPQLSNVMDTGNEQTYKVDEYKNYASIAGFAPVGEGQNFDEDSPIQAFGTSITPVKYGKLITITYELRKWSQLREIYDCSAMLGREAAEHIEGNGASVYNNAQNTSYTSLSDSKPLCSTQHTRADGGAVVSNASSTGIQYTEANQEVGILAMEFQVTNRGKLRSLFANQLIIPNALRKQALIINKSELKSGSADNDANVYAMQSFYGTMEVTVWNYISAAAGGSDTAWTLRDKRYKNIIWQWADKPQIDRDDSIGFKQQSTVFRGFYYAGKGWRDFRGLWRSAGDKAAFGN